MDSFDIANTNSMLENWLLDWAVEKKPVYTHCKECGRELSTWEKEQHMEVCGSCSSAIVYGGPLGVDY